MKKTISLIMILFFLVGCASTSRIINLKGQPPASALFPDTAAIAKVVKEINEKPKSETQAVIWTGEGYLVTPEVWEEVLADKVYLIALKESVSEFVKNYKPETLKSAIRKDMGTMAITTILILGALFWF